MALTPFLTPTLTDEEFNEMYLCCHEVNISRTDFCQRVINLILARRKQIATENAQLYRKRGNIQLDQNIGDTTMLMSEGLICQIGTNGIGKDCQAGHHYLP